MNDDIKNNKVIFFDCDETLWHSDDKDYISHFDSKIEKLDSNTILRTLDSKKFYLRKNVVEALSLIKNNDILLGIVSDNTKDMVIKALEAFNILHFFDNNLIEVKLWDGYCPKDQMIVESLQNNNLTNLLASNAVTLIDDKDYSIPSKQIGITFIQVDKGSDFLNISKNILLNL